ncbi:DEAD/DEAH box helicase [Mycobacterium sherrisii]|uniref:DEAD/DEAH box helicase n=1 Tax=Mycobacterium sherrisii TaxID=243061 RepID=UPI00397720E9
MAGAEAARPELLFAENFRPYQADAIAMVRRYRSEFDAGGSNDDPHPAALVYHPTGTGKTVVIAGIAQAAPEVGNVLILTTREAIRDQLVRELGGAIFIDPAKFGVGGTAQLSKVCYSLSSSSLLLASSRSLIASTLKVMPGGDLREFARSQFDRLLENPDDNVIATLHSQRSVLVMTIQMLVRLQAAQGVLGGAYAAMREHIDLVIFDEGHYEPAPKFSLAVRGLRKPTVLMTATPFRNDLKAFRVRTDDLHAYRFAQAIEDGRIRDVEVVQREPTRDPTAFCTDVIAYCTSLWGADKSTWQRVIIRCDDMASITRLGEAFIEQGFDGLVIGIHDRYIAGHPDRQSWHHDAVPTPSQTDAIVWIHQNKLVEGIDDHRFQVLAFFDPMTNVRAVVQQIGRVIRTRPGGGDALRAHVLDHFRGRIATYWDLYRGYDAEATPEALTSVMSRYYLKKLIAAQPRYDYIDKRFRRRLDFIDPVEQERIGETIADEILFARKVTFRQLPQSATLSDITARIEDALTSADYEFTKFDVSAVAPNTVIYLCAQVENVKFLNTYFFAEPHLEARLITLLPEASLLGSTSTGDGSGVDGITQLPRPNPALMERILLPGDNNLGRISSVSTRNTNLGNRVVRRRVISAPSIADVPPILDEYGHVVSIVTGYNGTVARVVDDIEYQENFPDDLAVPPRPAEALPTPQEGVDPVLIRRYVGVSSGHVSESGPPLRARAFQTWVRSLVDQMTAESRYEQVFGRYAPLAEGPITAGAAQNLLLDFTELADQYRKRDVDEAIVPQDVCVDRDGHARGTASKPISLFTVTVNDTAYPVRATFNSATNRYRLDAERLDVDFVPVSDRTAPLVRAINETQSFTIVPEDRDVIYVHGSFYAPALKFGPDRFNHNAFHVGHCLYPSEQFRDIATEKGDELTPSGGYDPDSLFGVIDGWRNGFDTDALSLDQQWMSTGYVPEAFSFTPSLVICDDKGDNESCDFILADAVSRRVVLVHAKASSDWRPFSASAVQEVCAQAQKNTALFSTYTLRRPANLNLWDTAHRFNGLAVANRIRKSGSPDAERVWTDELAPLLYNPLTSREIWIVLGHMLSAGTLLGNLQSPDPESEVLQLNQLLQTTIAAAGSVGAKARIFCAP